MDKGNYKILIADDDDMTIEMMSAVLSEEGYHVLTVDDGTEAIKMLQLEEIDLVFADYRMPGADGVEVLRHAMRINPDIAMVIMTAYGTMNLVMEIMQLGAFGYVAKPFKFEELIFIADKAYKMALLINDNKSLRKILRETYRDVEIINKVKEYNMPEITSNWERRIDRLKDIRVLTMQEAGMLEDSLLSDKEKK